MTGTLATVSPRQEHQRFEGTASVQDGLQVVEGQWFGSPGGRWSGDSGMLTLSLSKDGKTLSGETDVGLGFSATRKGAKPAPAATPRADTSPPVVQAYDLGKTTLPGAAISLRFRVKDDSGKATVEGKLFQGGTPVRTLNGPAKATGAVSYWNTKLAAGLVGPLHWCIWAKDVAGNRSANAPESSCGWIPLVVDNAKVSNGCGGTGPKFFVDMENAAGNSEVFEEPGGAAYTVFFVAACNLHDAGYGGHTVIDTLNGGVATDFHAWTRKQVDDKFKRDMEAICRDRIPAKAETAVIRCRFNWRYPVVRKIGSAFFDADLKKPDVQGEGTRDNN